jgi:peptide/nickel transport system permease protein
MLGYVLQRAAVGLAVALTISIVTFLLLNAAVDPAQAIAGEEATQQQVEQIRQQLGLDQPLPYQYWRWLSGVLQGDFGESYLFRQDVGQLILSRAPITITLALSAVFVTIIVAIPLGIVAAMRPNSLLDRFALTFAVTAQAVPNFWLGLILIVLLSVTFPIFPVSGDETWTHFVLPALVLGLSSVPAVMRLTRAGLIEVMGSDFIRTARAKGFMPRELLVRHALRNALLPVVSVLAVQLGAKLGGSVITESVFAMNGLGRLAVESILGADIPTLQMLIFIFAMTFIVMTFLADILNAWLDPRVKLS